MRESLQRGLSLLRARSLARMVSRKDSKVKKDAGEGEGGVSGEPAAVQEGEPAFEEPLPVPPPGKAQMRVAALEVEAQFA